MRSDSQYRLIVADPGHFHASLVQKDNYSFLSPRVAVYAPLGPELLDYLARIARFNHRAENPTRWELDIHTSPDFFERMLRDRAGNVVLITGRNRGKIDRILQALEAGYHVLADKPWIIASADLPKLESALSLAERRSLAAYDIMTERFEITSILQRELVNTPDVFGQAVAGTQDNPAVRALSIHHLMKRVAGEPIQRPTWFFDIEEYGEALADVGTHVVDLVQWSLFPHSALDYRSGVQILAGERWPTVLNRGQFEQVTGKRGFPQSLAAWIADGRLDYYCNNAVDYTASGIHVHLEILWNWEAPEGTGDIYEASFRGTRSRIEVRQGEPENFHPELYVVPENLAEAEDVFAALRRKVGDWQSTWPGISVDAADGAGRIAIPNQYRVGHEDHFAQVTRQFFEYVEDPPAMPGWEKANMLAKYWISTKGVEIGGQLRAAGSENEAIPG